MCERYSLFICLSSPGSVSRAERRPPAEGGGNTSEEDGEESAPEEEEVEVEVEVEEGVTCRNTDIERAVRETKTGEEGWVEVKQRPGGEI